MIFSKILTKKILEKKIPQKIRQKKRTNLAWFYSRIEKFTPPQKRGG